MRNGESLEYESFEAATAAFEAAIGDPLTTHKIADNSAGRHPKRYVGLSMRCHGFPENTAHMIPGHLDGRELAPGQVETTDISGDKHICTAYFFWYNELVNGEWVSVNPGRPNVIAPPGKYYSKCVIRWVPALYSVHGTADTLDALVLELTEANLPSARR